MFNRIFILFILSVYCDVAVYCGEDPAFRYDYEYSKEADGWLKLHSGPMRWEAARFQCYYEGAVLASPLDLALSNGIMKQLQSRRPGPDVVYSGVSASFAEGVYSSIEGVPLERMITIWSENEPALPNGCLVFFSNGTMGSRDCRDYLPFICYKKYEKIVINECGTGDNEYRLHNYTGKCYKFHSERENWSTAYKICQAEGAHLVIRNDYGDEFQGKQQTSTVFIGFKPIDSTWWNILGTPLLPRQPGASDAMCGGRNWYGTFTPTDCTNYNPFICEKNAESLLPVVKED